MIAPPLSADQTAAIERIQNLLHGGERVVALTGHAGSGKTTVLPVTREEIGGADVAAMSHKAAHVLRGKGVDDVATFHSRCIRGTIYSDVVDRVIAWINNPTGERYVRIDQTQKSEAVARSIIESDDYETIDDKLRAMGVKTNKRIKGYKPGRWIGGTLIVDEASMLDVEMLDCALQVYENILLIGDPFQLPPTRGVSALQRTIDSGCRAHLSSVHRQRDGSDAQGCATWIRETCKTFGDLALISDIDVGVLPIKEAGPVMVRTNESRLKLTRHIRKQLGIDRTALSEGEPVISRSSRKEHIEDGFYNNAEFTYAGDHCFERNDGAVLCAGKIKIEVASRPIIHPHAPPDEKAVRFRHAYAFTAHMAQGSEWPRVQVYWPDVESAIKSGWPDVNFMRSWLYTACSRARDEVRFFRLPGD